MEACKLVSTYQNVSQAVLQDEVEQLITGRGARPSIFLAVFYNQTMSFGRFLKVFVVIGVAAAAILNPIFIVVVVYHFVKKGSSYIFNWPCKRSSSDIDFVGSAEF